MRVVRREFKGETIQQAIFELNDWLSSFPRNIVIQIDEKGVIGSRHVLVAWLQNDV